MSADHSIDSAGPDPARHEPRVRSARADSLTRTAVLLGTLTLLGAGVIGLKAYQRSRDVLHSNIFDSNLSLAQVMAAQVESAPPEVAPSAILHELATLWTRAHHRYPDSYLCVIGQDGRLQLNTRSPLHEGSDVSSVPLQSPREQGPGTIGALVHARESYVGLHTTVKGEPQVAAFTYVPRLDALLAIHIPLSAVNAEVRSALLPWTIGYAVVIVGLLPLSLVMLQRAATRSQRAAGAAVVALADSAAEYRALMDQAADAITICNRAGRHLAINQSGCEMFGYSPTEFLETTVTDLMTPEELKRMPFQFSRVLAGETVRLERNLRRKDGSSLWVDLSARLLADGRIEAIHRDISDRKRVEQELHSSQEQLLQAQKMEAVGRLAGGIAHDFNNLLTAISGYAELLRDRLKTDDVTVRSLDEILRASSRATSLTQQLLAYSRRQILKPRLLALNTVLSDTTKILSRVIGEDIEILTKTDATRDNVRVDPVQIDQVLLNLVINARDSMPQGGTLWLETGNVTIDAAAAAQGRDVKPGDYAMIAISDTGCGMDEETLSHAFEPFFTTKELGKGTGLGLSTVYGIVRQTGGYVTAYSAPGLGTTFKVYLPVVDDAVEAEPTVSLLTSPRGTETILVVEDDLAVQALARDILLRQGYRVICADGPNQALTLAAAGAAFALLLTDVVMPTMNGKELATRLSARDPKLKVIYMSGYTANAVVHQDRLDSGTAFLAKPFTVAGLAQEVRAALDRE